MPHTPHWRGWLSATYQHPHAGSAESGALALALSQLEERHWSDFIDVVELSTSRGSAEAVAEILVLVVRVVGQERARAMWALAFRRWDKWDYGKGKDRDFLASPRTSSFDFPVSMYYAHLPAMELASNEAKLADQVQNIGKRDASTVIDFVGTSLARAFFDA